MDKYASCGAELRGSGHRKVKPQGRPATLCRQILPLSLSLNMHVVLHWTKTDALAARQCIITRQWALCRASSCLFTQINLSWRSQFLFTNTAHADILAAERAVRWNSGLSCQTANHDPLVVFYCCTERRDNIDHPCIPYCICCANVDCCLK